MPGAVCLESDEIPVDPDTDIVKSLDLAVVESHAVTGLNADAHLQTGSLDTVLLLMYTVRGNTRQLSSRGQCRPVRRAVQLQLPRK